LKISTINITNSIILKPTKNLFWLYSILPIQLKRINTEANIKKKACRQLVVLFAVIFISPNLYSQSNWEFQGQVSAISSYSPDNTLDFFGGARYLPQLTVDIQLDTTHRLYLEAAGNVSGSILFHPFNSSITTGDVNPYRLWARYTGRQFELRVGLQKIDFGSSTLLRPLQWFNQIDPRDPLQLTNGVYGALGRYYFLNNANIWLWVLYGNEKVRGFDFIQTNKSIPEFGGRLQYPVPKGELAISYHHRSADSNDQPIGYRYDKISENRIAIDGKWDLGVGLWFEATYSHKAKELGPLTNQTLFNIGTDYTFGIGNGLNVILENLLISYDEKALAFDNTVNITAMTAAYPLSFFDNISAIFYYNWKADNLTLFLNYAHQFNEVTGYLMAYYNPSDQVGIQRNDLFNNFSGPGIRLMFVYNH
jgi:hypothetical protein